MIGLGALFSAVTANQYHTFSPPDRARFSPISVSLGGITFAQLAFGVLGVLLISGEYSTGMIRSSLTAVPSRLPVLWGKLAVFAGACSRSRWSAASSRSSSARRCSAAATSTWGSARPAHWAVFGAACYLTLAGMIGIALGALLRNTAAGISTFVAVFFVIPPLTGLLPTSVSDHLASTCRPTRVGAVRRNHGAQGRCPRTGFPLLAAYAVVLIAAPPGGCAAPTRDREPTLTGCPHEAARASRRPSARSRRAGPSTCWSPSRPWTACPADPPQDHRVRAGGGRSCWP